MATCSSRFLSGLPDDVRESVLAAAVPRRVLAHAIVTNQNDAAEYLFLLTRGRARHFFTTVDGRKSLLLWLGPGDVFGTAALLRFRSSYLVSTEMVEDAWVAVWSRNAIRQLLAEYPILLDNSLLIASDYLTWYVASHTALLYRSARERLSAVLASLASGIGVSVAGGTELQISNEELANAANLTPFTTSRLLSRWQLAGAIRKSRGKLLIRHPEILTRG